MKAMKLTGIRAMEMFEVEDPKIVDSHDVKIKMGAVGICGSDVHYYTTGRIGSQVVQYPFTVGHECAGTVAEIGSAVTHVKAGDRIAVEPAIVCGECDQCKTGRENTCRKNRFLGCPGQVEGALAEYLVMPEENCFPLRKNTPLDLATISEPLAIGYYAVKNSPMKPGAKVAVLGFGPIGACVTLSARAAGAGAVYATEIIAEREAYASANGADWIGNPEREDIVKGIHTREELGMDIVYECCGKQETVDEAIELLKPGGTLMLIGIPEFDRISFTIDKMRRKEISIINVRRQCGCVQEALDLIELGKVDGAALMTHHFNFADSKAAFDLVADYKDGVMKAMVHFD